MKDLRSQGPSLLTSFAFDNLDFELDVESTLAKQSTFESIITGLCARSRYGTGGPQIPMGAQ